MLQIPAADAGTVPPASRAASTPTAKVVVAGAATAGEAWYLKIPEGDSFGPVSRTELDRWKQEGRIDAECQLGQGDPQVWRAAAEVYADLREQTPEVSPVLTESLTPVKKPATSTDLAAHRGTLILLLGLLGLTVCGIFTGLPAWLLGTRDLREMRAGRMDRAGEQLTKIGQILGIVSLVLSMVSLLVFVLMLALSFQG